MTNIVLITAASYLAFVGLLYTGITMGSPEGKKYAEAPLLAAFTLPFVFLYAIIAIMILLPFFWRKR